MEIEKLLIRLDEKIDELKIGVNKLKESVTIMKRTDIHGELMSVLEDFMKKHPTGTKLMFEVDHKENGEISISSKIIKL